jgi:hypothetical protein
MLHFINEDAVEVTMKGILGTKLELRVHLSGRDAFRIHKALGSIIQGEKK